MDRELESSSLIRSMFPILSEKTGNKTRFDSAPFGAGVTTVISARLAMATSAAGTVTLIVESLTTEVGRSLPFHRITVPGVKPAPLSTSVVFPLPSLTDAGETALSLSAERVTSTVFELVAAAIPVAGFCTDTLPTPARAMSAALIVAER
jgi:hypothetical protein